MPAVAPWRERNQYKRFCFTVNLPKDKDWSDYNFDQIYRELGGTFLIAGRETGEQEQHKHFQGYLEISKKRQGLAIDKAFRKQFPLPISCHYESCKGSAEQNIAYCSKDDKDPISKGSPAASQGQRSDLQKAMDAVAEGANMVTVAEWYPNTWAQYRKSLAEYAGMKAVKRHWPTQSVYLWGPTGTGKTMHAHELNPTTVYWTGHFLNGFSGAEDTLLFDDFDYRKMDWQTFLTITDRYPMNINIKGGWANFAPKVIVFTSNSDPKSWYPDAPEATRAAIHRRMDEYGEIKHMEALVPKEQNILTKYLIAKPAMEIDTQPQAAEETGAVGGELDASLPGASALPYPRPEIIDLCDDDEEEKWGEEEHSYHSVLRRHGCHYGDYGGVIYSSGEEGHGWDD